MRKATSFWIVLQLAALLICKSSVSAARAADESDAAIQTWDQSWTVTPAGELVYHEKKWVQINGDRAHGEFADPRITFDRNTQKVNIIAARTRVPGGEIVDVPQYSRNEVSPNGSAGWPAFASIRQTVLTFSAIEPGCVLELEYEITTAKDAWSEAAADIRLDHRYPIKSRTISLSKPIQHSAHLNDKDLPLAAKDPYSWKDIPAAPADEPQPTPWRADRPRFVFSTQSDAAKWVSDLTSAIDAAAQESPAISKLAADWAKPDLDRAEKMRALQEKLSATFNFVDFNIEWRNPRKLRSAAEVLAGNYGVPEEAAAALLALARSAGLAARPALLVSNESWRDDAPQNGFISAFVLIVDGENGAQEIWSPSAGRITRDRRWADSRVLSIAAKGLQNTELPAWTDPDESKIRVTGDITIPKDGNYTAKLRLRLSGLFVSREGLRTTEQQRGRIADLLGRVVPNADITHFNVATITDATFEADADLKARKPLALTDGFYRFALPPDGPLFADIGLPLTFSNRRAPVRLAGACDEQVDITIHWPAEWKSDTLPAAISQTTSAGAAEQTVKSITDGVSLTRHTRLAQRDLPPADFLSLRSALNSIRAEAGRTFLLKPDKAP